MTEAVLEVLSFNSGLLQGNCCFYYYKPFTSLNFQKIDNNNLILALAHPAGWLKYFYIFLKNKYKDHRRPRR